MKYRERTGGKSKRIFRDERWGLCSRVRTTLKFRAMWPVSVYNPETRI